MQSSSLADPTGFYFFEHCESEGEEVERRGRELTIERLVLEEKGGMFFGPKPEKGVAVMEA